MSDLRVLVADDDALLRDGIASLLRENGITVLAEVGDALRASAKIESEKPDVAILDIRMPPRNLTDGLDLALETRRRFPAVGILLVSQFVEVDYLDELLGSNARAVGYLLKSRVTGASEFVRRVREIAAGGCVIDPEVVSTLLGPSRPDPVEALTERERQVLALMAQGRSNRAISDELVLSTRTVESHIRQIFAELGLTEEPDYHRRVLAVLAYIGAIDR